MFNRAHSSTGQNKVSWRVLTFYSFLSLSLSNPWLASAGFVFLSELSVLSGPRSRQRKQKKKEVNSVQNCGSQWEKKKQEEQKLKPTKKVSGERRRGGNQPSRLLCPVREERPSARVVLSCFQPAEQSSLTLNTDIYQQIHFR